MTAALPAFLVEAAFYLASLLNETRKWFSQIRPKRAQAALLWLSALIPYAILNFSLGTFQRQAFYLLMGLTAVFAFWWAILPRRFAYDAGFLIVAAAPLITRLFPRLYVSPDAHLHIDVLGHLMWTRIGVVGLLVLREWDPGAFGFWPKIPEWRTGVLYYLFAIVPIVVLALAVHDVRYAGLAVDWWRTAATGVGTFFGILWVVALGDELFFRGVVERALLNEWKSPIIAVLVSAILFGSAHLWYRGFPDWRRAATVTLLGIPLGIAYARTGSVRAPMVTHALVVVTWRLFFK